MNAKDLLQALNDIDPKYIQDAQPWGQPVRKVRHPVWAAAAALLLCLGIGAGAVLLPGSPLALSPASQGSAQDSLAFPQVDEATFFQLERHFGDLSAPQNLAAGQSYYGAPLTLEQVAAVWKGELPWDQDLGMGEGVTYQLGTTFSEDGQLMAATIAAFRDTSEEPENRRRMFTIQLLPQAASGQWQAEARELGVPGDSVQGVEVYTAAAPVTLENYQEDGSLASEETQAYLAALYLQDLPASVCVESFSGDLSQLTAGQARELAVQVVSATLGRGLDLSALPTSPEDTGFTAEPITDPGFFAEHAAVELSFTQLSPEAIPSFSSTYGPAYAASHTPAAGEYFEVVLGEEPLKRIWQGDTLPWDGISTEYVTLEATAAFSEEGDLIQVYVEALQDDPATSEKERYQLFTIQLVSQAYADSNAADWSQQVSERLAEANNQIDGTPVVAGQFQVTALHGDDELDETMGRALFSTGSAIVTVTAASSEMAFPTQEEARAFVEQVVGQSLTTGIDLSLLQAALYANPHGEAELNFSQLSPEEPEMDFSAFLNGFTQEYIAPMSLASGGTYVGTPLSREDLEALWGGETPWDGGIHTTAYAHYSQEGELLEVEINGYTAEPQHTPASEFGDTASGSDVAQGPYQLFSVILIPQAPSGDWGDALSATLARANNQVGGTPVAAGVTTQTLDYVLEDGSTLSLPHTVYQAAYSLDSLPLAVSVAAFSTGESLGTFTPEEAKSFVEQVVGQSLYGGIDLASLQQ